MLLASLATSGTGDWLYGLALVVFVLERTHSPAWVAVARVGTIAPYVLFGTVAGALADRFGYRRIMIASDITRALLMGVLALAAAAHAPAGIAVAIAFLSSTAGSPFFPASAAITPTVVDERSLAPANALISAVASVALALGPALGGVLLVAAASPALAFLLNGATFVASAILLARLRLTTALSIEDSSPRSLAAQLVEGGRAVISSSTVLLLVGLTIAVNLTYGQEDVLYLLVSRDLLFTGEGGAGFLYAAIGIGGIAGAALSGRVVERPHAGRILSFTSVVAALPLVLLSLGPPPALAYALVAIEGGSFVIVEVLATTILQRAVSQDLLARVFGIQDSLTLLATVLGTILAPVVLALLGLRPALVIAGGLLAFAALVSIPRLAGLDRQSDRRRKDLEETVDFLASIDIFTGMTRTALEALAADVSQEKFPAGTVMIHEGDTPDDFFVIRSGLMEVISKGETGNTPVKVRELGPGDYAGEIGLLERVPRTATVRAATEALVYRIKGTDFLDLVASQPVAGALGIGVVRRLSLTHPSYRPSMETSS